MQKYEFPKDFIWGTASSSYQIEGAWNEDGKGESIWDRFCHIPGNIKKGDTGDVSVDFYHKYKEDVELISELGTQSFLYTISWPRVMPNGTGEINPKGFEFYHDLLKRCKDKGMRTMLALYHWDLPQALQNRGGWANREIVGWFTEYAKTCFRELGDVVDDWITMVEPASVALGYNGYGNAPGHNDLTEMVLCIHHLNMCHGAAIKAFRESGLKGRIGVKISQHLFRPDDPTSEADCNMAKVLTRNMNDFYMDPIFKGKYNEEVKAMHEAQGVVYPEIQPGDMELMCQPIDFYGLNAYNPMYVSTKNGINVTPHRSTNKNPRLTAYDWEFANDLLYDAIHYVYDNYFTEEFMKEIIITEGGCGLNDWKDDVTGKVEDPGRIAYLRSDLYQVHKAIQEGIPVKGYHVWSFFDNLEWNWGYAVRFGIVYVDYNTLERTPKSSYYWYQNAIKNNAIER